MTLGPMQKVLKSRMDSARGGPAPVASDLDGVFTRPPNQDELLFIGAMSMPSGQKVRVGVIVRTETSVLLDKHQLATFIQTLTRLHRSLP
jgi:hypothetical protein